VPSLIIEAAGFRAAQAQDGPAPPHLDDRFTRGNASERMIGIIMDCLDRPDGRQHKARVSATQPEGATDPMQHASRRDSRFGSRIRFFESLLVAVGLSVLAACTTLEQPKSSGNQAPGISAPPANETFPNLGSVPDQAPPTRTSTERQQELETLSADRAAGHAPDGVAAPAPGEPPPPPQPSPGPIGAEAGTPSPAPAPLAQNAMPNAPLPSQQPAGRAASAPLPGATPAAVIYFADGSAGLDDEDRRALQDMLAYHWQQGGAFRIVGHASRDGRSAESTAEEQANMEISWARANAIASELIRNGIDPNAVQTIGVGDTQPLYVETSPTGIAANRRADIYFVY